MNHDSERMTSTVSELTGLRPDPREDAATKTLEKYTASVPSSTYLAVAVGAMAVSLTAQLAGRGKWGNFIAQWVPTWLLFGLYNKLVKLEGHDRQDRGRKYEGEGARTTAEGEPRERPARNDEGRLSGTITAGPSGTTPSESNDASRPVGTITARPAGTTSSGS